MKKELTFGITFSIIAIALAIYFAGQYSGIKRSIQNNFSNPPLQPQSEPDTINGSSLITLSAQEVSKHAVPSDCWLIISGKVYNVSSFLSQHPGGSQAIINYCGQDATVAFATQGGRGSHSAFAQQLLNDFYLGDLNSSINRTQIQKTSTVVPSNFDGRRERKDD
jgi:cytochrome b involved in lipid metabolism